MTPTPLVVAMLLRLYPAAWRAEYGAELGDILSRSPLSVRVVADVLLGAMWQRLRSAQPASLIGAAALLFVLAGIASNLAAPASAIHGFGVVLQDSRMTLPAVVVAPFESNFYPFLLIVCGCWTSLKYGNARRPAFAAIKLALIAGMPVVFLGVLLWSGSLPLHLVAAGDPVTAPSTMGVTFTYYSEHGHLPSAAAIITAPLIRLPQAWVWGVVGGMVGRLVARGRRQATPASS